MAPDHDREIDQEQATGDLERAVQPRELGEQRLQAIERRGRPGERAQHHREGRDQTAAAAGDGRGLHHQDGGRSGARDGQDVNEHQPQKGDDVVHG